MPCPHCASTTIRERPARTQLGYRTFACLTSQRSFNERTATPFNYLTFPSDIVLQVVLWRLRYKLSLREKAEMFLERGFEFTHEAVREWEARFAPLLAGQLRAKRQGQAGSSWYVDETQLKVNGQWCYLNNRLEQDHRSIKQRYYPQRGFGTFASASRFCQAFEELRQFERYRRMRARMGSMAERRHQFVAGTAALQAMLLGT